MRGTRILLGLALCASLTPSAPAAGAAEEVHCTSVHEGTLSPGLSIEGSSGTASIPTGTMECHGPINGKMPTGIGSYSEEARYGTVDPDTCQDGGEGDGVFTSQVPTADGNQELRAPFTFTYGDLTSNPGTVTGHFQGAGVRGTFRITPVEGDCVINPVTRFRVNADFYFAPSFFQR